MKVLPQVSFRASRGRKDADMRTQREVVAVDIEAAGNTEAISEEVSTEADIRSHTEAARSGRTALAHTPEVRDSMEINSKNTKVPKKADNLRPLMTKTLTTTST